MTQGARRALGLWLAALAVATAAACAQRAGGLGMGASQSAAGGRVGYVDMNAVIAAHPLHAQLQRLQDQIAILQQEASLQPTGMTPEQAAAYEHLQQDLAAAAAQFQTQLAQRRAYYEQQEAQAISRLQAATLGTSGGGSVVSQLQQEYGAQAQAMQKAALATLTQYRAQLFKQDADHLRTVQQLLAADLRGKLRQFEAQQASAETKYQIALVKADQDQRLNLQAKLQNLALTDQERKQYTAQLNAIQQAEQQKIDALKAADNAKLRAFEKQLESEAAAKYNAARAQAQAATQAKLLARQKELQSQMQPQLVALSGKFQQRLNAANAQLASNAAYQARVQAIHNQMQSAYVAEAGRANAAYDATRKALVAKYSEIAHMQFEDTQGLNEQADAVAAQRRQLLNKIIAQISAQVAQIAQRDGLSLVVSNVLADGTAVDLTAQVIRAVTALHTTTAAPAATPTGGS
jgi:hypothetical protein